MVASHVVRLIPSWWTCGAYRRRELRRTRKAIGRQFGECGEHGNFNVLRHRVAQRVQRGGLFTQHLGHDGLHIATEERHVASEHLVRQGAERIDVAAGVNGAFAHRLLGAHVLRGPETQSGLRHARTAGRLHSERDAEIGHERAAIVQENVFRLDVAMNDVLPVRVIQRTGHFARDPDGIDDGELTLAF